MSATAHSSEVKQYHQLYINGAWVEPDGDGFLEVINSTTEQVMGHIPNGNHTDINRAVAAAKIAFPLWAATPISERTALLRQVGDQLKARQTEFANLIVDEVGMPLPLSIGVQVGLPITVLKSYLDLVEGFQFESQIGNSLIVREPIGVVGCITPWNFPLHQVIAKIAPALAVGCTVVLKPSEVAPLSAFLLAEIIAEIGFPPGVFNLVSGIGAEAGAALAAHPDVEMISFTGSTRAGKEVSVLAAQNVKRVALELGGKSANIILDDADLQRAVNHGVANCYFNSGQTCSALTRMIVPRSLQNEVVDIAITAAAKFKPGDPRDANTRLGPLVSGQQRERVMRYIQTGINEGATLVFGGANAEAEFAQGYFVNPTIFSDVNPKMTIAQEEIFGPVLAIIPYDNEAQAIEIANDTIYGLAGSVWSSDIERAKRVALQLRTGQVDINGGKFNPLAPFGGYKQSGNGREFGHFGLEEFLEVKSLQL